MYLAYGKDAVNEEENMVYIDRFTLSLLPKEECTSEIVSALIQNIREKFQRLTFNFKIDKDAKTNQITQVYIIYDRPNDVSNDDCGDINDQIILDAFNQYGFENKAN